MTARIAPQDEPSNTKVSTFEPSHLGEGKSGTCDSSRSSRRLPNIYCCSKGTELEHHQMGLLAELGIGSCSHYAAPQRRSGVHPHSRNRCNGSELYARSTFEPKSCKQTFLGEQAHGVAVALNNQAIAVILNFREACGRRGTLVPGGGGGKAGMSFARAKIGLRVEKVRIRSISYEMF